MINSKKNIGKRKLELQMAGVWRNF